MKQRLQAAEMWLYRKMLRISLTDRVRNTEVLRRAETQMPVDNHTSETNAVTRECHRKEGFEELLLTECIEWKS